jgi:hypothetical protein
MPNRREALDRQADIRVRDDRREKQVPRRAFSPTRNDKRVLSSEISEQTVHRNRRCVGAGYAFRIRKYCTTDTTVPITARPIRTASAGL